MASKRWSDVLSKQTRDALREASRSPFAIVPMKHIGGRFGIASGSAASGRYIVVDRATGDVHAFESMNALIDDGWAVD